MDEARAQLEERWAAIPVEEVGRGPVVPAVDTEYRNVRRNQATELDTLLVSANEARAMLDGALAFALPNDPEIATRLAEIRRGRGNSDLAEDLLDLVALATQNYDVFSERVRISREQLQRVAAVADRLLDALAFSSSDTYATLVDERRRAWSYFADCLDTVLQHGRFIHQGTAGEERYPSLYTLRRSKRRPAKPSSTSSDDDSASADDPADDLGANSTPTDSDESAPL